MDDKDGPSSAAQSAQPNGKTILSRLATRMFGKPSASEQKRLSVDQNSVKRSENVLGILNLRRMRVEDVAIPKAEIVAVADTTTKDELVQVLRKSGLTRIPVYDGTLDSPIGMVHLKDFA